MINTITSPEKNFEIKFLKSLNLIHEVKIYNEIQNNKKIIIIDLRTRSEYENCKIDFSVNLPYDELDVDFFSNFDENIIIEKFTENEELRKMLKTYKRFYIAVIMSESKICKGEIFGKVPASSEKNGEIILKSMALMKAFYQKKIREIGLFNQGFSKLYKNYSFLTLSTQSLLQVPQDISVYPSEVLDGKLYVGNQYHATTFEILHNLGITHIVNVTLHVDNRFENTGVKYLDVLVDDTDGYKISKHFKLAYDFIDEAICGKVCSNEIPIKNEVLSSSGQDSPVSISTNSGNGFYPKPSQNDQNPISQEIDNITQTLEHLGINSENWKDLYEEAEDYHQKNKIIQLLFKYFLEQNYKKTGKINNNKVLIHCSMGVSRSPTIAIMYIMKKFKVSFSEVILNN
jgi:rhodanese-related sulfurtransferase